jgi:hypothetical protein
MQPKDIELLTHFLTRTAMYTWPVNEDSIISFINGYSVGRWGKCTFTETLGKLLDEKYRMGAGPRGWSYQVKRFSEKNGVDWVCGFKRVGLELLFLNISEKIKNKTEKSVKTFVRGRIDGTHHYGNSWINDVISVCHLQDDWFCKLWNEKELGLLKSILKEIEKVKLPEGKLVPVPEKLKQLCDQFVLLK